MKIKKALASVFALSTLMVVPASAQAEEGVGYIRIGNNCYVDIGYPSPLLIPFPCPNTVSTE